VVRISDSLIRDNLTGVFLANGPRATISGTKLLGNSDAGVSLLGNIAGVTTTAAIADTVVSGSTIAVFTGTGDGGAVVRVSITRSTIVNNEFGVAGGGGAGTESISIGYSMVTGNATAGLSQSGSATLESLGNNIVRQNGPDNGTITPVPLR
jgi:nitrous oxidase accessory protein NosD